jgi:hypothetical protein
MGTERTPGRASTPATPKPADAAAGTEGKRTRVEQGDSAAGAVGAAAAGGAASVHAQFSPSSLLGVNLAQSAQAPDLTLHAPEDIGDSIAKFRIALDKGDADAAQLAWSFAKPAEKQEFGKSTSINRELQTIARVTGPLTIHVMAEAGLDFTGRSDLIDYMLQVGFPHWFDGIDEVGGTLMSTFLANLPARDALDDKALAKLDRIIGGMNSVALLKPLFERIYVPLSDVSYDPATLRTAPWQADAIHRLYKMLRTHLPTAHVRAVRSFHLGREKKEGGEWKKVRNAWWNSNGYVVLTEKSATAEDGGGREHRMTGGTRAFANPETGKGKVQGAIDRFDVGALHEVGHAVGDSLGGHAWARTYPGADWQTNMNVEAWSKGLWGNDAALTVRAKHRADDGSKAIASQSARNFLANELLGNGTVPPGWRDADHYKAAVLKQYGDQPLATYFKKCDGQGKDSWYQFGDTQNYGTDGRVYVYLSRGGNEYSSYTQHAHKQMVSWYSLSSPHEWFAEQYAHYYRLGKTGQGLEGGVAKKLAELDTQQPPAQQAPAANAGPGEDSGEDSASEGGAEHRVPFPW